jgi:uncharacterized protein YjbJ (UPF0337 family)
VADAISAAVTSLAQYALILPHPTLERFPQKWTPLLQSGNPAIRQPGSPVTIQSEREGFRSQVGPEADRQPLDQMPHKDEVKGSAKEARGNVKEAAAKLTGDEKLRTDGTADKAEGKVQKGVGKSKEAARNALKH